MIELDRFKIIEKIGEGSMGEVYKAHQISMDRTVAIKVLYPELAEDEVFADRFMYEARAIGKLNHPNIVQGIDFGRSGEHLYFVMEYINGPSLYDILRRGALEEDEVLEVALQVARALEHGHRQGIIHRDIKPGNIMISTEGAAKVTDYGLAKRIEDISGKSTASGGKVVGTPYYISPEQARGEEGIDIRSDIYSLGASLYHAATGKPPFPGRNAPDIMSKAINEPFPDPRQETPELTAAFAKLVRRLTQKDKAKRPADPAAVIREIQNTMRASATERHRQAMGANLRRTLRRVVARDAESESAISPRIKLAIAGAAAVVVIVILAVLLPGSGKPETPVAVRKTAQKKDAPAPAAKEEAPKGRQSQDTESYADEQMRKAQEELAEKAREAYLEAEAYARGARDVEEAVARLHQMAAAHEGPYAEKAKKLAGELQEKWEKEGSEELKARKALAAEALRSLNYGAAAKAYEDFPESLVKTAAGEEAYRLKKKILEQAGSNHDGLKKEAEKLASEGKYDEAVELYRKALGFGVSEITGQARARITALEKEKAAAQARMKREQERVAKQLYGDFYPKYAALVDKRDFKGALELCKTVLADQNKKEVHNSVRQHLTDIEMVIKVEDAAREAAQGLKLQQYKFELRGGTVVEGLVRSISGGIVDVEIARMEGAIIGVEISRLISRAFVKLALRVLRDKPESHLACGVYLLLARKDGAGAQEEFAAASAGGLDVSRFEEQVNTLRKHQDEQEANRLLDELVKLVERKKWKEVAKVAETLTKKYDKTQTVKTSRGDIDRAYTNAMLRLASEEKSRPEKRSKFAPGLIGTYFNGRNFNEQRVRRIDATVDFDWGDRSPHPDVNRNNFSVRWEGFVAIPRSGRYTFIVNSDDGCRMWLNGQELFNDWRGRAPTDSSKELTLKKGYYPVKVEYYEAGGGASAKFLWSVGGQRQVIPAEYLMHRAKREK